MFVIRSEAQNKFDQEYIEKLILSKQKNAVFISPKEFNLIPNCDKINNQLLIIYSNNEPISTEIKNFINKLEYPFFLMHLSDETLEVDNDLYKKSQMIIRSYHNPFIKKKECYTIPVGFQNLFSSSNNLAFSLQLDCSGFTSKNSWHHLDKVASPINFSTKFLFLS